MAVIDLPPPPVTDDPDHPDFPVDDDEDED